MAFTPTTATGVRLDGRGDRRLDAAGALRRHHAGRPPATPSASPRRRRRRCRRPSRRRRASPLRSTSTTRPNRLLVGEESTDTRRRSTAPSTWTPTVAVRIHGPFRTAAEIRCDGVPAARARSRPGPGAYTTPPCAWSGRAGTSTRRSAGSDDDVGRPRPATTRPSASRSRRSRPCTRSSSQTARPARRSPTPCGQRASGETVTVHAASSARSPPRPRFLHRGAGLERLVHRRRRRQYLTEPVTLTVPGYYTYASAIAATESAARRDGVRRGGETTVVTGTPASRRRSARRRRARRDDHRQRARRRARRC